MNMFELGEEAKDKITDFKGIIVGRAEYMFGCTQYCLAAKASKDGVCNSLWLDEGRIKITGKGIKPESVKVDKPGGPNIYTPVK